MPPAACVSPPLAIYLHWPYCARICPYCDFNVVRDRGRAAEQADLVAAMLDDLAAHRALTGPRRLVSIFFGGGTPSLLEPAAAAALIDACRRLWTPAPDLEVSLEANPTSAEAARFAALAEAGVERLSLGVQALDDDALRFLGRDHDAAQALAAVREAAARFPRLSLDLIYALPGQTAAGWAETLAHAADLGAGHLSPYQLTVEPGTAFARAVGRGRWAPADPELGAELYETTQAVLERLGYDAYEVSNHARSEADRSRHNLTYWRGWDWVGVGPGAHGRLTLGGVRHATETPRAIGPYIAAVRQRGRSTLPHPLSGQDAAEERVLAGLRTTEGVPYADLAALPLTADSPAVRERIAAGLLVPDSQRLRATPAGRLVLDRLTTELLLA